jgi:hypothetical protein
VRRFAHAASLLALLFATSVASAGEPTAADKATARSMLVDGYRELESGDPKRALELFRGADALMHVPTTRLAVARADAKLGKLVEAEDVLRDLLRAPGRPDDPPPFAKARADARALLDELTRRIPQLTITELPSDGTVKIDGLAVARESLAGPRHVDPGKHVISVGSPGAPPREVTVQLAEGSRKTLSMGGNSEGGAATTSGTPASGADDAHTPTSTGSSTNILAYAGFGIGALGVATGGVTGLLAISKKNDTTEHYCDGSSCPPAADHGLSTARTFATISTVGFIAGAVGIGVGIFALATGTGATTSTGRVPGVRLGASGVEGSF